MHRNYRALVVGLASLTFTGTTFGQQKDPPAPSRASAASGKAEAKQASDDELKQLQAAVDSKPDDLSLQLNLAQKLFQKGSYPEAWKRLRGVHEKAPEDQGVLIGIQAVMDGFKRQGLLNVGVAETQVIELLGPPHQSRKMPWGVRHVYGMMAIDFRDGNIYELVKLLGATNELFDASHVIDFELGNNPAWHVGIRQKGDGLTTAMMFREGESIADWKEIVTIERFVGLAKDATMKDVFAKIEEQIKSVAPEATIYLDQQDDETTMFAVNYPSVDNLPAKQQVVRLWMGPRDVHRLAYTHQGEMPSQAEGERWVKFLKSASLKPYDPAVSATSQAFSPRKKVQELAESVRVDLRKAEQYKPTEEALRAIAATDESLKKLRAYCDSTYAELEQARAAGKPNQTEILVFGPDWNELPGGYGNARQQFKEDVKFYGFKYVVPGETSGMSFDGVFEVDGKWYFLPKAHRAFR